MAKNSASKKASDAVERSAMEIALSIQRPGQSKEQTKLIARGIEKGVTQYKKRQSAKARDLDKTIKQLNRQLREPPAVDPVAVETVRYRQHWLPWALLILTWAGIAGVLVLA